LIALADPNRFSFCPKCGIQAAEGALFCGDCGTSFSKIRETVKLAPVSLPSVPTPAPQSLRDITVQKLSAKDAMSNVGHPNRQMKKPKTGLAHNDNWKKPKEWFKFWWKSSLVLFLVGMAQTINKPAGSTIDNIWLIILLVYVFGIGSIILLTALLTWEGRALRIALRTETPAQWQKAQERVQAEALEKLGRYLTLEEMQQWNHDRRTNAMIGLGVMGGIIYLHSWTPGKRGF
jgi:hypothetical protein